MRGPGGWVMSMRRMSGMAVPPGSACRKIAPVWPGAAEKGSR
jgi:hypothetical protein